MGNITNPGNTWNDNRVSNSPFMIAEVTSRGTIDATNLGVLKVQILNQEAYKKPVDAYCAMPFGGKGSGIIGPITPLSKVIVSFVNIKNQGDVKEGKWFYFGVIPEMAVVPKEVEDEDVTLTEDDGLRARSTLPEAKNVYAGSQTLDKVIIKSPMGHKLELADKIHADAGKVVHQENFAQIKTGDGKYIKLDDGVGAGMDRIIITDENDNRIVIKTGGDGDLPGSNSMVVECKGNMDLTSYTGAVDLTVAKGSTSNIHIKNDGLGDIHVICAKGNAYIAADKLIDIQSKNIRLTAKENITLTASRIDMKKGES
tara:strand:- start:1831 stop:2769 length:939 start_codon:yes stop_codon:yes gene_type:complete